ncbi:MAG: ABC transporter ATP-binding protein [Betaproteobacteria bacterium]|nr:ABC transporter ATP-binding protein [Betaproteobacteria bacterium]
MLELKGVSASYGRIQALADIDLKVPAGAIIALLGSNGAGKTTTLNVISRVLTNMKGSILYRGERVDRRPSHQIVALGIAQVPEGRDVFPDMSVHENLLMGAHLRSNRKEIAQDMERVCGYFPILQARYKQKAGTLSGGEQQMLLIARALMARPDLLLLDEPSLGLSPLLVQQIFDIIRRLHKDGLTILLVEQNVALALAVSSYAYILENGEIAIEGHSRDLLADNSVHRTYFTI